MADQYISLTQTTFGKLQADQRYKQLELSIKMEKLKEERIKNATDDKITNLETWPSTSSINFENMDSSYAALSHQNSMVKSEIVASSSNLRNMLLRKNSSNIKKNSVVATSSVKSFQQNNHKDQVIMPPPARNTVYRSSKGLSSSPIELNYKKAMSTVCDDSSTQLSTNSLKSAPDLLSANAGQECVNTFAKPTTSIQRFSKIDIKFLKWKVKLNNQLELIIKGTLECGRIVRSKPIVKRLSAICVESKNEGVYILQGNIVDETNALPDYIREKFYNGFPNDWENVYQVWRSYVMQGCPVIFHWPTRITDSDDDLKSELTDVSYTCLNSNQTYSITGSLNVNKCTKIKNLGNSIGAKEQKSFNYSAHSSHTQNCENNPSFVKPLISNFEEDEISVVEIINKHSLCHKDNKQNTKTDITLSSTSKKINKIQDILQEDKLNIIINNLADKNCSSKYISKFFEMFDYLDYMVSYKSGTECNNDSVVSSHKTFNSEVISLEQNLACNDNCANTNKFENKLSKLNSHGHSLDLGYGSIRNDFNTIQLSNTVNVKPRQNQSSDESESEIYAGVRKIPVERVLKAREPLRKKYGHKIKKKSVRSNAQKCASGMLHEEEENVEFKSAANSVINTNKNVFIESCTSMTEDEVEIINNVRECCKKTNIQRPQKMFFDQEIQRNNFDMCKGGKSVMQNKQSLDFEAQGDNLNILRKEQKLPYRNIKKDAQSQFVTDIDFTSDSDIEIVTGNSNTRKTDENVISPHVEVNKNNVITNRRNSAFSEKLDAFSKVRKNFTEQEVETKKSKPTIISSMPVHLNLKIHKQKTNFQTEQPYDAKIFMKNQDKQDANNQLLKKTENEFISKTSVASKSAFNDPHLKIVNNEKMICSVANNKSKLKNTNLPKPTTNSTTEQSKTSKLDSELKNCNVLTLWMPNVVHCEKSKTKLGLIFKGKLLNKVGNVVQRNFTTNIIAKRLSATLIETVDHEIYQLLGHLNDKKHTIPKELAKQCRHGCPIKIDQFCLAWKNLMNDNIQINEKLHNMTIYSLNTPISSRGRRILPPLSYWTGERISLKDNNPIYSPGNSQEKSLVSSSTDDSKVEKHTMNAEKTKKQRTSFIKDTSKNQNVNEQTLPVSEVNKNLRKRSRNFLIKEDANSETPRYTMSLRKRQKVETSSDKVEHTDATNSKHSIYSSSNASKNQETTCHYYQTISKASDLSEDESI